MIGREKCLAESGVRPRSQVSDARRSHPYGKPVVEGTWLYSGSVPVAVRILRSDVAYGTGDHEDEPEDAADRRELCFYVEWEPAGGGSGGSVTGPFTTEEEAKTHVDRTTHGVRWVPATP
jgi:hypothetical protein